jgi:hypothetical protein
MFPCDRCENPSQAGGEFPISGFCSDCWRNNLMGFKPKDNMPNKTCDNCVWWQPSAMSPGMGWCGSHKTETWWCRRDYGCVNHKRKDMKEVPSKTLDINRKVRIISSGQIGEVLRVNGDEAWVVWDSDKSRYCAYRYSKKDIENVPNERVWYQRIVNTDTDQPRIVEPLLDHPFSEPSVKFTYNFDTKTLTAEVVR